MERRPLGGSGRTVPRFALGTMTFGAETAAPDAFAILDAYLAAGGDLLDLADVYAGGESERIVGAWLADRGVRDQVTLATKARFPVGDDPDPARRGLDPAWLRTAIDDSLTRLGVDHVELFQIHAWDPLVAPEVWLPALDEQVRAGKIGAVGVSNVRGYQLQRVVDLARHHDLTPIVSLQPEYNLLARAIEWELVPCCLAEDVAILPWSPLGGGWLTGKYRREADLTAGTRLGEDPGRGVEAWDGRANDRTWAILDVLDEVAAGHDVGPAQAALAWVSDRPGVAATILGVRTLAQLEANLAAAPLHLDDDATRRLDEVSAPATPSYPYALTDQMDATRRQDG